MILDVLRKSEFGDLAKLCSPRLFSVLPALSLAKSVKNLMASRDAERHAEKCARHAEIHRNDGVSLVKTLPAATAKLDEAGRIAAGSRLLRLYFRELFFADEALIDLRPNAFRFAADHLDWAPAALSITWDPAFLRGLRDTYRGFYAGDDVLFRRGLATLRLDGAEDLFREHFGADPAAVRFSTRDFTHTFGLVFEECAKAHVKLSGDFVAFGFLLAALYQSLESLDVTLDVRAAFVQATSS